jgi:transcriptional regulator with XRE-family HTH domain
MKIATNQQRLNELFDADPRNDTSIANALGVSKQTISMWRSGARSPKKSMLIKIAAIYNVSIEWLMGFDVNKESSTLSIPIVVPDSERFVKLIRYMPHEEYKLVIDAFAKAEKRMEEEEGKKNG